MKLNANTNNYVPNNIVPLILCHVCHKKVKPNEHYTKWEGSVYCDPCFDVYVELLDEAELAVNIKERE